MVVCEVDCAPTSLPPYLQHTKQNPQLQAAVSALSRVESVLYDRCTVQVGIGDSVDQLDAALVMRTCTAAGRILSLSAPLMPTPA